MKRLLVMTIALGMCVSLVGCGSDPREGLVAATIQEVEAAATKVSNIRNKIDDAVKKTETGKTPDFKEALLEIDGLKKIAKLMQELKVKADALKDKTTEEERKELTDKNRLPLNKANERVAEAHAPSSTKPWLPSKLNIKTRSKPSATSSPRPTPSSRLYRASDAQEVVIERRHWVTWPGLRYSEGPVCGTPGLRSTSDPATSNG